MIRQTVKLWDTESAARAIRPLVGPNTGVLSLEALSAGDRDGDGAVTISEAHDYPRERAWQFTQGQQRPAAESTILGLDPIVLRAWECDSTSPPSPRSFRQRGPFRVRIGADR